jgi:hypothetical protein
VPAALLLSTVKAVNLSATGAATSVVSAHVAALTQGVLKTMLLSKLKLAAALLVIACLVGTGVGASLVAGQSGQPDQPAAQNAPDQPALPRQPKQTEEDKFTTIQRRLTDLDKRLEVLTKELMSLRKELKPPAPASSGPMEYRMFSLRYVKADELAKTLEQLFNVAKTESAKTLRIAAHASSNTLVVRGPATELEAAEAIAVRLDNQAAEGSQFRGKKE